MGKSHVPAPWYAQRVRRPLPYDGDCPVKPPKRIRWGPVLCPPLVSVVNSDLDFAGSDSPPSNVLGDNLSLLCQTASSPA